MAGSLLKIRRNFRKLSKSGLEIFDNFGGDDIGIGRIGAVFE
jgi:hypothetical protein